MKLPSKHGEKIGRICAIQSYRGDPRKLKHLANVVGAVNRAYNAKPDAKARTHTVLSSIRHIMGKVK